MDIDDVNDPKTSDSATERSSPLTFSAPISAVQDMKTQDSSQLVNARDVRGTKQKRKHVSTKSSQPLHKKSRNKKRAFPWEKLPFELRHKIFALVDDDYARSRVSYTNPNPNAKYFKIRNSKMPALVVALRKLPISYDHVLQWVLKNGTMLNIAIDQFSTSDMNGTELRLFKSLEIGRPETDIELTRSSYLVHRFTRYFKKAVSAMLSC